MHVSILGADGFLGRKLAARLARDGKLGGTPITGLTLFDVTEPDGLPAPFPVETVGGDVASLPRAALPPQTDVVFHLAAVVSAAAEADYDLGLRVNLHGTESVIDACRRLPAPPRVVFTGSVASYSGGQGAALTDDSRAVPANSYGAQKAAAELLLIDAARRGFVDAVCLRLPTIMVRPGRPNRAASGFISAIVREPLLGLQTELPVPLDFAVWIASPRRAVAWLLHAASMNTAPLGLDRGLSVPGLSVTIAAILHALDEVEPRASQLVQRVDNKAVFDIVSAWPPAFDAARARMLGFSAHEKLVDVIRAFVADDLAATRAERGL